MTGAALARAYSDAADRWLAAVAGPAVPGTALAAVGGYGRRELCPGSDIDVVLVHKGLGEAGVQGLADRVWYPLWDTGVRVDHSVRTLRQALRLADEQLEVAVGLLDARCVWGDGALVASLAAGVRDQWRRSARRRLVELADSVQARHGRAGEVAFLLEPDLKEGRGGLRDVVALRAAAAGSPVVPALGPVLAAADVLVGIRVELHRRTGRRGDRLSLEEQDGVAAALGYPDADALVAAMATAARTVTRAGDDAWRRIRSWVAGPRGRVGSADRSVGPSLALRDGEVALVGASDPDADRSLVWRAAAASAETGAPLAHSTIDRLGAAQPVQTERWTATMRHALVALLASGHEAVPVFEELDEAGLLVRLLPEWEPVRSRPQRNAFHRFTVDRHLCETAAEAAALARRVDRPDLLLVGAWLHDIGKGHPGDHTEAGMGIVETVATRMGFAPADIETLISLVGNHLLLPDVASRRDLDDPATVAAVAARVGSLSRLDLLAALAEADGRATGPAAWGTWKAGLVDTLVSRARQVLEGEPLPPPGAPLERALAAVPATLRATVDEALDTRAVRVGVAGDDPTTVAVVAPDRPGLLALLADLLSLHGLVILAAVCAPAPEGVVLDVFTVEHDANARPPGDSLVGSPSDTRPSEAGRLEAGRLEAGPLEADLALVLDGRLPVAQRLAERHRAYARQRRRQAAQPAGRRILFDAGDGVTVVEVRAADQPRLLHRVALAFTECGLDVRSAKVATLGHEVVDTFSVAGGGRAVPPERWPEVEAALLDHLD